MSVIILQYPGKKVNLNSVKTLDLCGAILYNASVMVTNCNLFISIFGDVRLTNIKKEKGRSSKMKIAKKVLALVMAVAMIASLSAMVFAADGTTLKLVAEKTAKGYTVTLVAENAEGLKTVDGTLTYDATVLQAPKKVSDGAFIDAYKEIGESCSSQYNLNTAGEVIIGIAIANEIYSDAKYADMVEEFEVEDAASITTDSLELCSLKFTVLDADAKDVKITYTDKNTGAVASVVLNETVVEPETTTAPVAPTDPNAPTEPVAPTEPSSPTEPVAPTEPSSEKADDDDKKATDVVTPDDNKGGKGDKADGDDVTGNAVPTDVNKNTNGNKTTGDNMALAAAASVVVLAGAAFVFTKKRK